MIVVTHEALQWAENHCKETQAKYNMLKGYDTMFDLVVAYQEGAKFIQNELAKVINELREKSLEENVVETAEQGLVAIKNESAFEAYENAIKQIKSIMQL